jgi:hypothetical protein
MPIPAGFVSHIDLLDPLCYPGSGLIIEDLESPSTVWNISASGTTYDGTIGALTLTTQSIEANAQLINTGDGPITIAGWVKINQYSYGTSFNCLPAVGKALGGNQFKQIALYGSVPNAVGLGNCSNGSGFVYGNVESPINTWVFVVVKKNTGQTTSQYKTYINGLPNEAGSAGANVTTSIAYDGTFSYGLINGTIFGEGAATFPMTVSQYWMYNSYLSDADVLDLYNATVTRYYPPAPVVEYDFQNGSYPGTGSTITDLQGGDTNLTVGNGHWVSGTPNYFDLQGDTNLFNTSPGIGFSSTTFTVNCWYNPLYTNPGTYASVWALGIDGNPTSPILSTNVDGTLNIQWSFGYGIVSTTVTNDWHLISFVSNGSTTTLYVDGISIGSNSSGSGTIASPYMIRLGSGSTSSTTPRDYAYGKIGYWSYFDVALDAGQVLDLYNATEGSYITPPPPSSNGVGGRQFAQGFNG